MSRAEQNRVEQNRDGRNRVERSWVERLREREELFRRAPSAHNTQPWTPTYAADHIDIGWDPARSLPAGDPTRRDLYLGLGAFVETCLIVATDTGLAVDAVHTPEGVRLIAAPRAYVTRFTADDIAARRVARGRYAPGQVDPAVLAGLEPGLRHLPARDLADDLTVADRWMFAEPVLVSELRQWLRLSPGHPRYGLDGLTDRALVLSRTEAVLLAVALRLYPMGRRLGLPALLAASGGDLLRYDGSVLVLVGTASDRPPSATPRPPSATPRPPSATPRPPSATPRPPSATPRPPSATPRPPSATPRPPSATPRPPSAMPREEAGCAGDPVRLVDAGRRLLRTWLDLARHGLAVHPLSQLIDSPVTSTRLGDRVGATPLAVFRVGRPLTDPVRSARLQVS